MDLELARALRRLTLTPSKLRTALDRDRAWAAKLDEKHRASFAAAFDWRQRHVAPALASEAMHRAYFAMRRSLWMWEEFATLRPGARTILEIVIELAREEALPWFLAAPSHEVRRLARLTEMSFARSLRELECLAITRPGRIVCLGARGTMGAGSWPGTVDEGSPQRAIAQWVVRYRRGIPWNAKRAAWWINYDLLCCTGRVLPCFEVNLATLSKTYQGRNQRMGRAARFEKLDDDAFAAMERTLAKQGPLPPAGMRAARWSA